MLSTTLHFFIPADELLGVKALLTHLVGGLPHFHHTDQVDLTADRCLDDLMAGKPTVHQQVVYRGKTLPIVIA